MILAGATPQARAMFAEIGPSLKVPEPQERLASIDSCSSDEESTPALAGAGQRGAQGAQGQQASAVQARIDPVVPRQSVLHELIGVNRLDKVKKQLKKGANVNEEDSMGETPLFWAISEEAVDLLVASGADITWRNNVCDCSAFFKFACQGKHLPLRALARHLSKAGILGDYLDDYATYTQRTALHAAAGNGYAETVRELLSMGVDHSFEDYLGKTALDLARRRGFQEVVEMLEF